jgi:hypothetical protein
VPGLPPGRTTSSNPAIPPLVPGLPPAGGRPSRHDEPTGGHRPLRASPERPPLPAAPDRRPAGPPARPAAPAPPAALGPPAAVRRVRPEDQGRTPGPFSQQFPIVEDAPPTDHPLGPRDFPAGPGAAPGRRRAPAPAPAPSSTADADLEFDELFGKAKDKERDRDIRRSGRGKPKKKAARRPAADPGDGSPSLGSRPELTMPGDGGAPPLVPGLPPAGGRASRHDDPDLSPLPPTGPGPIPRSGRPDRRTERRLPPEGPELRPAPADRPSLPPPESLRHEQTAEGWPAELEWRPPDGRQGVPHPDSDDEWWDDDR